MGRNLCKAWNQTAESKNLSASVKGAGTEASEDALDQEAETLGPMQRSTWQSFPHPSRTLMPCVGGGGGGEDKSLHRAV